jgi:predicted metal-dependent phosphoesterase TrpH
MCIDLHTHSIYSDGSSTPLELVELAIKQGITALALTDHDTMDGVEEMMQLGEEYDLTILSGVEISAMYNKQSIHLLGYGIDPTNSTFTQWLALLQGGRTERNHKILASLQELGFEITDRDLQQMSGAGLAGRPHIANILIKKGIVRSFDEAFRSYLGRGKKAWHCRFCYSAIETISAIHRAGGIAVLAHPGQIDSSMKRQPALIRELALYGLDGIEIYYPSHSKKMKKKLFALAAENNLLVTGGSDYHGATRPANMPACSGGTFCPPVELLAPIVEKINQYK